MKINKILTVLIPCALFVTLGFSQVLINPTAGNQPFFNLDQLVKIQLINTSKEQIKGIVHISMEDHQSNTIFQMHSLPLELSANQTLYAQQIQWEQGLEFGNQAVARSLARSGKMNTGQYVYCYRFVELTNGRSLGTYCQENGWQNFQLPQLAFPANQTVIQTKHPLLNWHPPLPIIGSDLNYSIQLVEVVADQTSTEAIYRNLPLLELHNQKQLFLNYPISAIPLQEDKKYAWQVTAYWGAVEMGKTDIWEFAIEQAEEVPEPEEEYSYRFVKRELGNASYIFSKDIHFAFDNRLYEKELTYKIYPAGKESALIKNIPTLSLVNGINQLVIPIHRKLKLKESVPYVLEIQTAKKAIYFLEFKVLEE